MLRGRGKSEEGGEKDNERSGKDKECWVRERSRVCERKGKIKSFI